MLTILTPFLIGLAIQISAMVSAALAAPADDHTVASAIKRDDFAYRLDQAVFVPSILTLLSAALLNRGRLSSEVVTFIIAGTLIFFLAALLLWKRYSASRYMLLSSSMLGVTPLNFGVIVLNVILGAITLATATPVPTP